MRRRECLAAIGGGVTGSVAGCLGARPDDGDLAREPLDGRSQYAYDAGSTGYAPGLVGPTSEPEFQRRYTGARGHPLTTKDAMFNATVSIGFDGETRWDVSAPVDGSTIYPALYEDSVLSAGRDPRLVWARSQADGTELWRTEFSAAEREVEHGATVATMPRGHITVRDDRAYFSTNIGIACIDLLEREEAWHTDLYRLYPEERNPSFRTPAATAEHVFALNDYPSDDASKRLYALDPATGEIDWTVEIEPDTGMLGLQQPIVGNARVFVTGELVDPTGEELAGERAHVVAIDPGAGEVAWRESYAGATGPTHASHGSEYLYLVHGGIELNDPRLLSAIHPSDGSIEWTAETETTTVFTTITDDAIYASDLTDWHAFDRSSGDPMWRIDVRELLEGTPSESDLRGIACPPVVQDGRLYAWLGEGEIAGFW